MMEYTGKQKSYLKSVANGLDAIVKMGGKGVTENLIKALDEALTAHELVKVSSFERDRDTRTSAARALAEGTQSQLIAILGRTMLFYRENPDHPTVSKSLNKIK
ncbi:MAG: YhbY family RNA-binding protein [Candidatus Cloacimonetes bacterium]|nr:YhbY family RNA-binding protein [Candidatus Cloacimonadota bacterium]